ncbi:DMT family transporter [Actinoallomurus sp. CA-150999]|uniref:DMT family transporter n=1 Tax=Actinoallomurus sp. CA-150999 TaxID=3239887 RepID=UPI003D8B77EA
MSRQIPIILASGSALAGSAPPIVMKVLPPTDVATLLILRFSGQGILLLLIIWLLDSRSIFPSGFTLVAGLCFATYSLTFFEAIATTSLSHAVILSSLYPLELLVLSLITRRQRVHAADVPALVCVTAGLLALWDGRELQSGDLLAALSSLAFAGYIVANNRAVFHRSLREAIAHQAYVSVSCAGAIVLLTPAILHSSSTLRTAITGSWKPAVCIALVGALSNSLLTMAQTSLSPLTASIIAVSSPVIAALIGAFVFDPGQLLSATIGCCLCGLGLVIISYRQRRLPLNKT